MDDDAIKELINKRQSDNRISCKAAMEIAEQAGTSRMKIGQILNDMKIKIHSCQLGCFK